MNIEEIPSPVPLTHTETKQNGNKRKHTSNDKEKSHSSSSSSSSSPSSTSLVTTSSPTPSSSPSRPLNGFIKKMYSMMSDPSLSSIIGWDPDGLSFSVFDEFIFQNEIMKKYFRHSNYSSFVRQLNFYNFHKKNHQNQNPQQEKGKTTVNSSSSLSFWHPDFRRDRPDLLANIHRKSPDHPSSSSSSSSSSPSSSSSASSYKDEISHLKHKIVSLQNAYDDLFEVQQRIIFYFSKAIQQQQNDQYQYQYNKNINNEYYIGDDNHMNMDAGEWQPMEMEMEMDNGTNYDPQRIESNNPIPISIPSQMTIEHHPSSSSSSPSSSSSSSHDIYHELDSTLKKKNVTLDQLNNISSVEEAREEKSNFRNNNNNNNIVSQNRNNGNFYHNNNNNNDNFHDYRQFPSLPQGPLSPSQLDSFLQQMIHSLPQGVSAMNSSTTIPQQMKMKIPIRMKMLMNQHQQQQQFQRNPNSMMEMNRIANMKNLGINEMMAMAMGNQYGQRQGQGRNNTNMNFQRGNVHLRQPQIMNNNRKSSIKVIENNPNSPTSPPPYPSNISSHPHHTIGEPNTKRKTNTKASASSSSSASLSSKSPSSSPFQSTDMTTIAYKNKTTNKNRNSHHSHSHSRSSISFDEMSAADLVNDLLSLQQSSSSPSTQSYHSPSTNTFALTTTRRSPHSSNSPLSSDMSDHQLQKMINSASTAKELLHLLDSNVMSQVDVEGNHGGQDGNEYQVEMNDDVPQYSHGESSDHHYEIQSVPSDDSTPQSQSPLSSTNVQHGQETNSKTISSKSVHPITRKVKKRKIIRSSDASSSSSSLPSSTSSVVIEQEEEEGDGDDDGDADEEIEIITPVTAPSPSSQTPNVHSALHGNTLSPSLSPLPLPVPPPSSYPFTSPLVPIEYFPQSDSSSSSFTLPIPPSPLPSSSSFPLVAPIIPNVHPIPLDLSIPIPLSPFLPSALPLPLGAEHSKVSHQEEFHL